MTGFTQGPPGVCAVCHNPYDPMGVDALATSLRGWAHGGCLQSSGLSQFDFERLLKCCDASESLRNLCGGIIQVEPAVPGWDGTSGEIWRAIPSSRQVLRYRLDAYGRFTLVQVNLPPPPPATPEPPTVTIPSTTTEGDTPL